MSSSERPAWPGNRISAYVLFAAIAGAPLPFGSRDMTTIALWCFVLGLALVFASPRHLRKGHKTLLIGIGFVALCYAFVLHEQLSEHPWIAQPNPIWAKASELLGREIPPSVSVVRGEPFYALGRPLVAVLAIALGIVVGTNGDRARQALAMMAWSGAAYATYGIAMLLLEKIGFFSREIRGNTGGLTGTFINRNTAAAYFGSCAAVWLILATAKLRGRLPRGPIVWAELPEHLLGDPRAEREIVFRLCLFFVCLAAMLMTGSRGGVIVSSFVMVLMLAMFFSRDLVTGKGLVVATVGLAAVGLIVLQILGGNIEARIDVEGLTDQGRIEAWRTTLRIIADYRWFGTGLGTFASIYPAYRGPESNIRYVWESAHSTPLELAVEVGIPLSIVVALAWAIAILVLVRGTRRSRRKTVVPLAALGVSVIAVLHSLIDFSLQVPGYAIVVCAVLGLGLAESVQSEQSQRRDRDKSRRKSNRDAPD